MNENRPLTLDDVRALEDGCKVWLEPRDKHFSRGVFTLHKSSYDPWLQRVTGSAMVLASSDSRGVYVLEGRYASDFGVEFRAWRLPQPPTYAERAANPWHEEGEAQP